MKYDKVVSILGKVTACVARKYHLDWATAEDFANRGLEYSFRYFFENKKVEDWNEKDVFRTACWKADNLVKDSFRKTDVLSGAARLDETPETEEGELVESTLVGRWSFEKWRENEADRAWRELGHRAYARLEYMFDVLRLSRFRRDVFRKVYLERRPVAEVCAHFGIVPNYAYGIVFGVRKGLAKVGPAILAAA